MFWFCDQLSQLHLGSLWCSKSQELQVQILSSMEEFHSIGDHYLHHRWWNQLLLHSLGSFCLRLHHALIFLQIQSKIWRWHSQRHWTLKYEHFTGTKYGNIRNKPSLWSKEQESRRRIRIILSPDWISLKWWNLKRNFIQKPKPMPVEQQEVLRINHSNTNAGPISKSLRS